MDANLGQYVIRSIQKAFLDAYGSFTDAFFTCQKRDYGLCSEWVDMDLAGPRWNPSRSNFLLGEISITVHCFVHQTASIHRINAISGKVASWLANTAARIYTYPADEPEAIGWVRFGEADARRVDVLAEIHGQQGGKAAVPIEHEIVTAEGRLEIKLSE